MRRSCLTHVIRSSPKLSINVPSRAAGSSRFFHHETKPYNVAVVGGGITGLTAAWRLLQDPKCEKITLYEKSSRLGGWFQSETIDVDGGQVVFEYGPRTIRASESASLPLMDMIVRLNMSDEVSMISKSSPAALNRYIYYPDHMVRVPGPEPNVGLFTNITRALTTLLGEPLFDGSLRAFLKEPFLDAPSNRQDESIGEFISRRFSPKVADNLASAVFHGIFAGDIYKLSAQTILGVQHFLEKKENSVIVGMMDNVYEKRSLIPADHLLAIWSVEAQRQPGYWDSLRRLMKPASVITLKKGLGELARRLTTEFEKHSDKIEIVTNAQIKDIRREESNDITISTNKSKNVTSQTFNRVIATIPPPELSKLISAGSEKDSQKPIETISRLKEHNYAVNVMVINLFYNDPNLIPYRGFGYLIPRSIPFEQNPERGLGVIFGSETSRDQDTVPGTKLTVIMGGHWWDGWTESDFPSSEEAITMARSLLKRQLGIEAEPAIARARFQRDAIPQFRVNHITRMQGLSRAVRDDFNSRLTLAGNWYNMHGVGVNDCIIQGYLAASWGVDSIEGISNRPFGMSIDLMEDQAGGIPTSTTRYLTQQTQKIQSA